MSGNPQVRYTFLQHVQQGMPYLSGRAGGGSTYVLSPFSLYTKNNRKKYIQKQTIWDPSLIYVTFWGRSPRHAALGRPLPQSWTLTSKDRDCATAACSHRGTTPQDDRRLTTVSFCH